MELQAWLDKQKTTQMAFSLESGVPQSTISNLLRGGDAKGETWAKIMRATRGKVSPTTHFPRG